MYANISGVFSVYQKYFALFLRNIGIILMYSGLYFEYNAFLFKLEVSSLVELEQIGRPSCTFR